MALSTPPPPQPQPPDPPSSTTSNPTTRPPTPQQPHLFSLQQSSSHYPPTQPRLPPSSSNPNPSSQLLYPVASSGRGFLPKPTTTCYPNRPLGGFRPPFVLDPGHPQAGRPAHLQHVLLGSPPPPPPPAAATGGVIKGFPVVTSSHPKIAPTQPSISDCNGLRDGSRDRNRDDTIITFRDRKVRISDNASFYTLCRSWLRNGAPDETQSQYLDGVRSLPRPSPPAPQDAESPVKHEGDKEEEEEDGGSVEHLSSKELLQRHVKRAKRIRSRLRDERLRRIARYKTRLALLLPPMVEQQIRNDPASGN